MSSTRHLHAVRTFLVLGLAAALALSLNPATASAATGTTAGTSSRFVIDPEDFGIHSFSTKPGVPAGSIRMNCWPTWREMNPRKGVYRWAKADEHFARVASWGIKDIMFVFCGTPRWTASRVQFPASEVRGRGTTSAPEKMAHWRKFVNQFVKRYRSKVDSYQVWNEITTPQFWQGTGDQAAKMTKILNTAVNKRDPSAKVVSASMQSHRLVSDRSMVTSYSRGLQARGWPIDVLAYHGYATGSDGNGPGRRVRQLRAMDSTVNRYSPPKRVARWDTETNYSSGAPDPREKGRIRGKRAAAYAARTYLDGWRFGYQRTYWYVWTPTYAEFPGIQLRPNDPATAALKRLSTWTVGTRFLACRKNGSLTECSFKPPGRKKFKVVWSANRTVTFRAKSPRPFCAVYGAGCTQPRSSYPIGAIPVRVG